MIRVEFTGDTMPEVLRSMDSYREYIGTEKEIPGQMSFPETVPAIAPIPVPIPQMIAAADTPVAPIPTALATPQPVPTAAPSYGIDQITKAIAAFAELSDANWQAATALISKYEVEKLTDLPVEQYNNFVLELRQLGAQI